MPFLMVLLCMMAMHTHTAAQTEIKSPQLLLLNNGQIIEGIVSFSPNDVSIQTTSGSRLVISNTEIDTVCESRTEAYWHKAAQTKATDLAGQRNLFHWCLSQNLPALAQNQIDIIAMMDIKATELEYLHRQLSVAIDRHARKNQTAKAEMMAATEPAPEPTISPIAAAPTIAVASVPDQPFIRPLPNFYGIESSNEIDPMATASKSPEDSFPKTSAPEIAQVGFLEAVEPMKMPATEPAQPIQPRKVSIDELERLTKSLPKPAVAMFKRKIEPLLVRSCFAEGCHQSSDDVMPLTRIGKGQLIPRRLSQRNLHSIIRHADPNEPLASPLLTAAMTTHGGIPEPIIKPSTKQFENLATWLIMISNKPYSIHQMPAPDMATRPKTPLSVNPTLLDLPESKVPVNRSKELSETEDEDGDDADPHDPDIFNRQFREENKGG